KESHPEYERNEDGKTRVNQRWRAYIRMESHPNQEPPSQQSCPNPDQSAEHPGRKERTDNIDLRSHGSPLIKISRAKSVRSTVEGDANYGIKSKHEIRNRKQIQMTNRMGNSKRALLDLLVPIWTFDVWFSFAVCFGFRYSDFGFSFPRLLSRVPSRV